VFQQENQNGASTKRPGFMVKIWIQNPRNDPLP